MARKVVWTEPAADDLVETVEYIGRDSPSFAASLAQRVCDAGDKAAPAENQPPTKSMNLAKFAPARRAAAFAGYARRSTPLDRIALRQAVMPQREEQR